MIFIFLCGQVINNVYQMMISVLEKNEIKKMIFERFEQDERIGYVVIWEKSQWFNWRDRGSIGVCEIIGGCWKDGVQTLGLMESF